MSIQIDQNPTPIEYQKEYLSSDLSRFENPFGLQTHVFHSIWFAIAHVCGFYFYFYLIPFGYVSPWSLLACLAFSYIAGLGVTVGTHRYWTHKTFKANMPLQILLMIMQTMGFQDTIFKWCRSHRVHHKFTGTNADPTDATKGFWFSHITWILLPRPSEVEEAYRKVEISDLANDPVVRFQAKYYPELLLVIFFAIPMAIFKLLFPEWSIFTIFSANCARFLPPLHATFLVNSLSHMHAWGSKPYDKNISSVESNLVSFLSVGEGFHNFHHAFPWDYKTSEFGSILNTSTSFINFFAWLGWAWELKTISKKMLVDRVNRTGDGSHPLHNKRGINKVHILTEEDVKSRSWGWSDQSNSKEDILMTDTIFAKF